MTALFHVRIALLSNCSHALFNEHKRLAAHKAFVARRTTHTPSHHRKQRRRRSLQHLQRVRATSPPSTPHRGFAATAASSARSTDVAMVSQGEIRRRSSVAAERTAASLASVEATRASITPGPTTTTTASEPSGYITTPAFTAVPTGLPARQRVAEPAEMQDFESRSSISSADADAESMPPPPRPRTPTVGDEEIQTRPSRSSTASSARNTNRLSLTLPIALPTSDPSRPTPTSTTPSVLSSFPPTPVESALLSPIKDTNTSTNDFIIAVAGQERRVLELREELARAEAELTRLKKQWATHEQYKKRNEIRNMEPLRPIASVSTPTTGAAAVEGLGIVGASHEDVVRGGGNRQSIDLDRRKALLLQQSGLSAQNSPAGTPTSARRKVFRGAHTRTLSLVSPIRPTDQDNGFSVLDDGQAKTIKSQSPDLEAANSRPFNPALSKRASWAPRSAHGSATGGVKQIAEDFKLGLWSFVEDIRQATVGDEPITGHYPPRLSPGGNNGTSNHDGPERPSLRRSYTDRDGDDTIRAFPAQSRPRVNTAFESTSSSTTDPTATTSQPRGGPQVLHERGNAKVKGTGAGTTKATKHFSWTPLTFDAFDDNDWSNWESPGSAKSSTRWSGSTVGGSDGIASIPEKGDENETPLKKKSSRQVDRTHNQPSTPSPPLLSPTKLEELLPQVVHRFSPSNIKRTASDLMTQWEKSLATPTSPQSSRPVDGPLVEMIESPPMSAAAANSIPPTRSV